MAVKSSTVTIRTEVPTRLHEELEALVEAGLSQDLDGVVLEALRRYAESHSQALIDAFVREDVEWGLRGSD